MTSLRNDAHGPAQPEVVTRVVFGSAFEAAWAALQPPSPAERALFERLRGRDGKFQSAYALEEYAELLLLSGARFPMLSPFERNSELGKLLTLHSDQTVVGRALFALLRVLAPARSLRRMTQNLRTTNNFSNVTLQELGPQHFLLQLTSRLPVGFEHGVMSTLLSVAGASRLVMTLQRADAETSTYDVQW